MFQVYVSLLPFYELDNDPFLPCLKVFRWVLILTNVVTSIILRYTFTCAENPAAYHNCLVQALDSNFSLSF